MNFIERLKVQRKERIKLRFMFSRSFVKKRGNGLMKLVKTGIMSGIEALLLGKTPKPFNEIEVW